MGAGISAGHLAVARSLALDAAAGQVTDAMRAAGVRTIVLKGPSLASLLYRRAPRAYVDIDLLVPPSGVDRAEQVLAELGFERRPVAVAPALGLPHAVPWSRSDGAAIDLHQSLAGVATGPEEVWQALERRTRRDRVGGVEAEVLDEAALALVVAMHAAQHGREVAKPIEDLRRALELLPEDTWRDAAALAEQLVAGIAFSSGLRLLPEGEALADRLGLPPADVVDLARPVGSPQRLVLGFDRLARAEGIRSKLALLAGELFPRPAHMRWWSPLARRGRRGLAAAYVARAARLLWDAAPSLVTWLRMRSRDERGGRG